VKGLNETYNEKIIHTTQVRKLKQIIIQGLGSTWRSHYFILAWKKRCLLNSLGRGGLPTSDRIGTTR
jgi:hypothetical protein